MICTLHVSCTSAARQKRKKELSESSFFMPHISVCSHSFMKQCLASIKQRRALSFAGGCRAARLDPFTSEFNPCAGYDLIEVFQINVTGDVGANGIFEIRLDIPVREIKLSCSRIDLLVDTERVNVSIDR